MTHTDYSTEDALEAREFIDRAYGGRLKVGGGLGPHHRVTLKQLQAGPIVSAELDMPVDLLFEIEGRDEFVFTRMLGGTVEFDRQDGVQRFKRGDLYLAISPDDASVCRAGHAHAHTINLSSAVFDDVIRQSVDQPSAPWRFTSHAPVVGGAERWRQAVSSVSTQLSDLETVPGSELIIASAARYLASVALTVFPNTVVTDPATTDGHDAHADTLTRAIAFIDANPDLDITVAEIARAAYVSARAVQLAFRRHLDTTPTAYLRRVRLSHARRQLLDAGPGDGLTITRVAVDWGFGTTGGFSRHYRAAYGETPSATLSR